MLERNFRRTIENFRCGKCGREVEGNGYTNHCPECLWSKHVDVNPGDRAAECGGMMEPIDVVLEAGEYVLTHHCKKCGFTRRKKVEAEDNFDEVTKLTRGYADF